MTVPESAHCTCGHSVSFHGAGDDGWECTQCECPDFEEDLTESMFDVDEEKGGNKVLHINAELEKMMGGGSLFNMLNIEPE